MNRWLMTGQRAALWALPVTFALGGYWLVGFVPTAFDMIFELRGIIFKASDALLLLLLFCTAGRLAVSAEYRIRLVGSFQFLLGTGNLWAGLALILWMLVGALWSVVPGLALYQAIYTASLVFLLVVMHTEAARAHRWLVALLIGGSFQALIALVQWLMGGSLGLSWLGEASFRAGRPLGLTFNPNTLASYLMLAITLTPALLMGSQRRPLRMAVIAGWLCCTLGLLATGSRAPLLAALLLGILWLARWFWRRPLGVGRWLALSALGVLLLAGVTLILNLRDKVDLQALLNRAGFAWAGSLAVYQSAPIVGVGAGQVMLRLDLMVNAETLPFYDLQVGGLLQPAHNAYLNVLAELGLPGLLGLGLLGLPSLRGVFCPVRSSAWGVSLALYGILIVMWVEFHFWLDPHWRLSLFWVVGLWWAAIGNSPTDT